MCYNALGTAIYQVDFRAVLEVSWCFQSSESRFCYGEDNGRHPIHAHILAPRERSKDALTAHWKCYVLWSLHILYSRKSQQINAIHTTHHLAWSSSTLINMRPNHWNLAEKMEMYSHWVDCMEGFYELLIEKIWIIWSTVYTNLWRQFWLVSSMVHIY